ncbi:hypothetical protein BZM27_23765 [Paraburkholderia steynii]|uniref:Uncharacterized protein n=1 Tax=Paraburkholderia steynii TaxID=1245441 RepID=A0A4R0X9M0_9BURK|nr:hypothetical protein BZM27_23765 [Paraburkholderia steynii]
MKAHVFIASEIPKSFRLDNYEICANWGIKEWCAALSHRYAISLFAQLSPEEWKEENAEGDGDVDLETVQDWTLANFESPLQELGFSHIFKRYVIRFA